MKRLVVLSGGLGGARVARALESAGLVGETTFITNIADDLDYLGLRISPDVDSVFYAMCQTFDFDRGWGRKNETYTVADELTRLGQERWFTVGDLDLALHLRRHSLMQAGDTLTEAMARMTVQAQLPAKLLPASDNDVRTHVVVDGEQIDFQTYHVAMGGRPKVDAVEYVGLDAASPGPDVITQIKDAEIVLIAPSSPVGSIDPILGLRGVRSALQDRRDSVVMMSPVIASLALSNVRDEHHWRTRENLLRSVNVSHTPEAIANYYSDMAATAVIDHRDRSVVHESLLRDQRILYGDTLLTDKSRGAALKDVLDRFVARGEV